MLVEALISILLVSADEPPRKPPQLPNIPPSTNEPTEPGSPTNPSPPRPQPPAPLPMPPPAGGEVRPHQRLARIGGALSFTPVITVTVMLIKLQLYSSPHFGQGLALIPVGAAAAGFFIHKALSNLYWKDTAVGEQSRLRKVLGKNPIVSGTVSAVITNSVCLLALTQL